MRTYVAEVTSPCGGQTVRVEQPYLADLDAAIDRAFGIACDERGYEIGAISLEPVAVAGAR